MTKLKVKRTYPRLILKQKRRFWFDKVLSKGYAYPGMKLWALDLKKGVIYEVELKYNGTLFTGIKAVGYTYRTHPLVWASNIRRANKYLNQKLLNHVRKNSQTGAIDSPTK